MKIRNITCKKFAFDTTPKLEETLANAGPTVEINLGISLSTHLNKERKTFLVTTSLAINGDALPCVVSEWLISFSELPENPDLKALTKQPELSGALARAFGSLCNNINWIFMNTAIGPLPLNHLVFMGLLDHSLANSTAKNPVPGEGDKKQT